MEIFVKNIFFYDKIGFSTKNGLIWILLLISTLILYSLISSILLKTFLFSSEAFPHRSCPYISFSFFFFLFILFSFPFFLRLVILFPYLFFLHPIVLYDLYILQGWHCEGSVLRSLFGLLMWDQIFVDCPDVFLTPYQDAPLDLCFPNFIRSR